MPEWPTNLKRLLNGFDEPARSRSAIVRLYLSGLGLIYLVAFLSLRYQWKGIWGRHGILPAADFVDLAGQLGYGFFSLPTLAWMSTSDAFFQCLLVGGAGLAVFLTLGFAPRLVAGLLWVIYLSLCNVGGVFLQYQWESLLLEAGFLAIFLAPGGWLPGRWRGGDSHLFVFLHRFLLFRLIFSSGVSKLLSGDPTWRDLTALRYHYETQPLPTPLAWYAHQLPPAVHQFSGLLMLVIEIPVCFLFFFPRRFRLFAFFAQVLLQGMILLTGNYGYFNWLTLLLCLLLLDDDFFGRVLPKSWVTVLGRRVPKLPSVVVTRVARFAGGVLLGAALLTFLSAYWRNGALESLLSVPGRLRLTSTYGLFAVMTTERDEIIIEGSDDEADWRAYEFPDKPGDVNRAPPILGPYLPRADWQAWFAALDRFDDEPWLQRLCLQLLKGERDVDGLFAMNPFVDHPPKYLRLLRYRYHFTTRSERARSGAWWKRERLEDYSPVLSLR